MSYTAVLDTEDVTATRINTLAGELDGRIEDIKDGTTAIVPQIADFTSAQHDHSDADDGGKIVESAVSVAGGSAGQVLTVNPGGTASEWADTSTTALTTKGDLLTKDNLLALARVAVGSNNQVLVADSAQSLGLKWAGRVRMATGTYTGDGLATKTITGVGFQPEFILLWDNVDATTTFIFLKSDQDGTKSRYISSIPAIGYKDDHIVSFNSDGFVVGDGSGDANRANVGSRVYYFVAFVMD